MQNETIKLALESLTAGQRKALGNVDALTFGVTAGGAVVVKDTCGRCGGCGHYSYTPRYGTRCFDCNVNPTGAGIGFCWTALAKYAKRAQRIAAAGRKAEAHRAAVAAEAEMLAARGFVDYATVWESAKAVKAAADALANAEKANANAPLIGILRACYQGNFVTGILADLETGRDPRTLPARAKAIIVDMAAKNAGRRNSKEYAAAVASVSELLGGVDAEDVADVAEQAKARAAAHFRYGRRY